MKRLFIVFAVAYLMGSFVQCTPVDTNNDQSGIEDKATGYIYCYTSSGYLLEEAQTEGPIKIVNFASANSREVFFKNSETGQYEKLMGPIECKIEYDALPEPTPTPQSK